MSQLLQLHNSSSHTSPGQHIMVQANVLNGHWKMAVDSNQGEKTLFKRYMLSLQEKKQCVCRAIIDVLGEFIHVYILYIYIWVYIWVYLYMYRAEAGVPRKAIEVHCVPLWKMSFVTVFYSVLCSSYNMWECRELVQHADNISVICCPLFCINVVLSFSSSSTNIMKKFAFPIGNCVFFWKFNVTTSSIFNVIFWWRNAMNVNVTPPPICMQERFST